MAIDKLGFFQQFFSSISGSYKELVKQTFGKALGYLLIVGVLFGAVHAVKFFINGQYYARIAVKEFVRNAPDFTFNNGELSVDAKMPIVTKSDNSIIIVDTSDQPDESLLNGYEKGVMFERDRMINKRNRYTRQELLFSELKDWSFTKRDVLYLIPWIDAVLAIIAVFVIMGFIIAKICSAFFLSLVGLMMNAAYKTRLPYSNLLALCIYALTFPMILLTVKLFVPDGIPFFALFYFALAIVYVWIGIRASIPNNVETDRVIPPINSTLSE